jgi:hypothetical protein
MAGVDRGAMAFFPERQDSQKAILPHQLISQGLTRPMLDGHRPWDDGFFGIGRFFDPFGVGGGAQS